MSTQDIAEALKMEPGQLYREEVFTDRRAGTIRRLVPVTDEGLQDPAREVLYVGQTQILTAVGTLPIAFEIPAKSLEEAVAKFGDAAKEAVEDTLRELQELRREAASRIVIPEGGLGGGGLGGAGGGMPPGGIPGGGIQLP
ncbi:hypothetical protein [Inmirania thermothiophila]|uniref:Uncharacterized protein n=1 Tax=Inmirania thermothiophila TaxID=1750597 RepID=A0A3N1YAL5_9GAMM|nr:hypothetical protein [Inmirania thermothiophila]ROR34427.1 hypothetical protein EDC57_0324 [Inmirania thermothiophila]